MADPATRRRILALHTHPEDGSPFWLERMGRLGLDRESMIREPERVPPLTAEELRGVPVEGFLPRRLRDDPPYLITADTSGFSGLPVTTVFTEGEFHAGFVAPFVRQAEAVGFPLRRNWLWAGPSGPHAIGKAVRAILRHVGGMDPFAVDFDPRWYRCLPAESMSSKRYFEHVSEQVLGLLSRQRVEVIFSTPPVIAMLAERMSSGVREGILGVHYGGMGLAAAEYARLRAAFPRAVHLHGYGNSLFGMFPEVGFSEAGIEYGTESARLDITVVRRDGDRLLPCAVGERGQVMMSRFDASVLLLNMVQEDWAMRTEGGILDPGRETAHLPGKLLY
ncbi:MAG: hypothetical protein JXR77_15515 [Lentisphaeria bacterium]|nr:hypothetical protein [Lentisphaeria bacterium]